MGKKKIFIALTILFLLFFVWYFTIKENDFSISFRIKASKGVVFRSIQDWFKSNDSIFKKKIIYYKEFENIKIESSNPSNKISYNWHLIYINDSITKVNVGIKDAQNSFFNRLIIPFHNTNSKNNQTLIIKNFKEELEGFITKFKIRFEGIGTSESVYVAYINLNSKMENKASNMIKNNETLVLYLKKNGIKMQGLPYLEVLKCNFEKQIINYNFCFPIYNNTKYIEDKIVKFKLIPSTKGLKATYFGNYETSDRAWYYLNDYAKKNNLKINCNFLENFKNNPFNGGNDLEWETQIIIPTK